MDNISAWFGVAITALGAAFGYGKLSNKVENLEKGENKVDKIFDKIDEIKEAVNDLRITMEKHISADKEEKATIHRLLSDLKSEIEREINRQ